MHTSTSNSASQDGDKIMNNLSLRDIGLLTIIRDLDAQNVNIPSVDFLTKYSTDGISSIRTGLNVLIKNGKVERLRQVKGIVEIKLVKDEVVK